VALAITRTHSPTTSFPARIIRISKLECSNIWKEFRSLLRKKIHNGACPWGEYLLMLFEEVCTQLRTWKNRYYFILCDTWSRVRARYFSREYFPRIQWLSNLLKEHLQTPCSAKCPKLPDLCKSYSWLNRYPPAFTNS
jgi:hypothetical protein